jgi:hypothetical protein
VLSRFEGAAKKVIEKMRNKQPLTEDDREKFSAFVALMYLRTPFNRAMTDRAALELARKTAIDLTSDPDKFSEMAAKLESSGKIPRGLANEAFRLEALNDALAEDFFEKWHMHPEFSLTAFEHTNEVATFIYNMHWRIESATDSHKFVTSDTPVAIAREEGGKLILGLGPAQPDAQLTFPITKDLALLADHRNNRRYRYTKGDAGSVAMVNERTIIWSDKYVYAHMRSDALWEEVQESAKVELQNNFANFIERFEAEGNMIE